jgi:4-methylaminobutanoate oxidase (formaldehyde-forming)
MEKGYRYFGTDLTMLDTPYEAGLGAFVRLDAGPFIGRDALTEARARGSDRRLRTLVIGGREYEPIYGGEAVRLGRDVIGRLRSVAYGPTIERTIAYAYLPASTPEGAALDVDVFDRRVAAVVAADVLVDPAGKRMRA